MLIDTHTHLYLDDFAPSPVEAVDRAVAAGVEMMIFPNVGVSTVEAMTRLNDLRQNETAMAMGLHPTEVGENWEADLRKVLNHLETAPQKYVAVGEIGIDLYWDKTFRNQQIEAFRVQAEAASRLSLPIIIHCREGLSEVLEVLGNMDNCPAGVFHSFGGTVEDVEKIRSVGDFYFGINGIVTFKNSKLKDVLPHIGVERMLLETDSPYLAPVPHRGKRNESAYLIHTLAFVAEALGIKREILSDITTENALHLFSKLNKKQ